MTAVTSSNTQNDLPDRPITPSNSALQVTQVAQSVADRLNSLRRHTDMGEDLKRGILHLLFSFYRYAALGRKGVSSHGKYVGSSQSLKYDFRGKRASDIEGVSGTISDGALPNVLYKLVTDGFAWHPCDITTLPCYQRHVRFLRTSCMCIRICSRMPKRW